MFEKEAEEYTVENVCSSCYFEKPCENKCEAFGCADSKTYVLKAFKDGAEFGYNKANEWHYVKDEDFPTDVTEREYLVALKSEYTNNFFFEIDIWCRSLHCFASNNPTKVYAWKEIVLPELPKESE